MRPIDFEVGTANDTSSNFAWFLKLRWGFLAAQLVVFLAGDRLRTPMRLVPILAIVGVESAANLGAMLWLRSHRGIRESSGVIFMALDTTLLSFLLYVGGADSNPLAVLYLVNVALAVLLVQPKSVWFLAGYTLFCGATVAVAKAKLPLEQDVLNSDPLEWQLREMWLALGVTAALLVYFLHRTTRMLRDREQAVEAARAALEKRERLASLTTLAAGAAHELATPLSTIAVAAKELQRQLANSGPDTAFADAKLIREEVDRCRRVLLQLSTRAAATTGDKVESSTVADLLDSALDGLPRGRLNVSEECALHRVRVPKDAFAQAVRALVQNAVDADPAAPIFIRASSDQQLCTLEVTDRGPGMSEEIIRRAGEPFFTTKEPGKGMGLGIFLARSVAEQLGGTLELDSRIGSGTTARLSFPAAGVQP